MDMTSPDFRYSAAALWSKLARVGRRLGQELVELCLCLHFAARRPETPAWARGTIYAALAYFLLPTDLVPDILPGTGYSDDIATLALAMTTVSAYINEEVRQRARETARRWMGPVSP
jgi:uncharacterized membrane protein YkvA (DUF1232 family)